MSRKLASIVKIDDLVPIKGADRIELAKVKGWQAIVQKNEFKIGEKAIYCEIDSFLPCITPFAFLEARGRKIHNDGTEGYRIKTLKMKGILSQGILFPLNILWSDLLPPANPEIGDDVTADLGIKLYEPPSKGISTSAEQLSMFPYYVPKSDEERVQNLVEELKLWKDIEFIGTEKLDGCSFSAILDQDKNFHVCSRNFEVKNSDTNLYGRMVIKYDIEKLLRDYNRPIMIQGEIIGEGVQKNPYRLTSQHLYVFHVFDLESRKYFTYDEMSNFCYNLSLNVAPQIFDNFYLLDQSIEKLLQWAPGKSILNGHANREGIVFRSKYNIENCMYGKISFKVISNDYLLKEEN